MSTLEEKSKALTIDFKQLVIDPHPELSPEQKQTVQFAMVEGIARRLMAQTSILEKLDAFLESAGKSTTNVVKTPAPQPSTSNLVEEAVERAVGGNPED